MVTQIPAGSGRSDSWWQAKRGEIIPLDPAAAAMEEIRKRVMKDAEEAFAREVLNRLRTWILSHTRLRPAETGLNINMTFQPAMTPPKPRNGDWMWMAADGEAQGGHQPLGVGGPPSPPDFGWTSCGLHKPWVTASSKGWR